MTAVERLLKLAVARRDRVAEIAIRARIESVPYRPKPEPVSIWTRRMGRAA